MLDIIASYHCLQFYGKLMNQTSENGKKSSFGPDFRLFGPNSTLAHLPQILATEFFFFEFFSQALSVTRYHGQLSSCTISEKTNDPILRKLSGGRTDGQTETDQSDFMRHCPTNVVHSINHPHCIQSKFNCPEIKKTLSSNSLVIFYMLNNYFFYSQVASSYVPYKPFLFFFFSKILISFSCLFLPFGFFLLQKEFDIFYMLLFWVFLCVFNIHLPFLYIEKKIIKKYFVFF